jgi:hypothetical protein
MAIAQNAAVFQPFEPSRFLPFSNVILPPLLPINASRQRPKRVYGEGWEAQVVRDELKDFDYKASEAWRAITDHFGVNLRLPELKGIIYGIIQHINNLSGVRLPMPSRNAKRNLPLLVKYVDFHYTMIVPFFRCAKLYDEEWQEIPFLDATIELSKTS